MSWSKSLAAAFALLLSACATPGEHPALTSTFGSVAPHQDPHAAWWTDNRWRYPSEAAAEGAYQALVSSQSPWPEWHQVEIKPLPVGLRFQMALSPGQPTDRPGAFGTFDPIPDVAYVRRALAVKVAWKPAIDRVVTYEVTDPLPVDTGTVGPQIDSTGPAYLPGGGSQLEMKVPAPERIRHLKVIEVREIR
jgi:hypothetical protein